MGKRGLSAIVTTMLMVALVLVAAVIVWAVVKNLISEGVKGISFGKFMIDLKIKNANIDGQSISVQVERKTGNGDLTGIKFIFFNGTDSEVITKESVVLEELEEKTFVVVLTELSALNVETVSIAPIYMSDAGENVLGDILDTYYFVSGNGENGNGGNGECIPVSDPCETRVCGTADNGTCGEVSCPPGCDPVNEICVDGVCEPCTPDCGERVCGPAPNGCGDENVCGPCSQGECIDGVCIIETSINNGTVDSIWPPDVGLYFDSEDLPKFGVDYTGYYINFTGLEIGCLLIVDYIIPVVPEEYNKTHIRFNFPTDIQPNDNYEIWENCDCGGLVEC